MDLKKTFGFDREKADGGVWVDIGQDAHIKIAKFGTNKYQLAAMRHTRKYQAQIRAGRPDPESLADITANILADSVLLDWRGITEDDASLPYSRANAYRLLRDYPDFRAMVEQYANDMSLFQDAMDMEEDAKNSWRISNGSASMGVSEPSSSLTSTTSS
jgi:hypothetical protein